MSRLYEIGFLTPERSLYSALSRRNAVHETVILPFPPWLFEILFLR